MSNQSDEHLRSVLPIPDQVQHGLTTYDAKDPDTRFPPIQQIEPPEGAPNVLIVLIDNAGFGSSSAFGGPCETPNFEKLAKGDTVTLYYDGEKVGEGKVAVTEPLIFSATEGLDIGREMGTTVLPQSKAEDTVLQLKKN